VAADYSSGHLLFLRGGSLVAQSFDTERLSLTGEATSIPDEVRAISAAGLGVFTASQNSELIYLAGKPSIGSVARLEWVDRAGKSQGFLGDSAAQEQVFPSPDGQQVVVPTFDSAGTHETCGSTTSFAGTVPVSPSIPARSEILYGRQTRAW
jgi:hypothetical protein